MTEKSSGERLFPSKLNPLRVSRPDHGRQLHRFLLLLLITVILILVSAFATTLYYSNRQHFWSSLNWVSAPTITKIGHGASASKQSTTSYTKAATGVPWPQNVIPMSKYLSEQKRRMVGNLSLGLDLSRLTSYQMEQLNCAKILWKANKGVMQAAEQILDIPEFDQSFNSPCWWDNDGTTKPPESSGLHCLPKAYLAGTPKSGSTDFYRLIVRHPDIAGGSKKEVEWWNKRRWGVHAKKSWAPLFWYTNHFTKASTAARESGNKTYHPLVIFDGSISIMGWQFAWPAYPGNEGEAAPRVLSVHELLRLTPDAKFIVLLRNPASKLYSSYMMAPLLKKHSHPSPEDFHKRVLHDVSTLRSCVSTRPVRHCMYDDCLDFSLKNKIRKSLYFPYIADLMQVVPQSQLLVLKFEEYATSRMNVFDRVFNFLNISKLTNEQADQWSSHRIANHRRAAAKMRGNMYSVTRDALNVFYAPWNQRLAELLNDSRFLWAN